MLGPVPSHLPVLKVVILVLDLSPWPILKGSFLRTFLSVREARLSYPMRVLAREDLPTPYKPQMREEDRFEVRFHFELEV